MLIKKFAFHRESRLRCIPACGYKILLTVHQSSGAIIDCGIHSGTAVILINSVVVSCCENLINIEFQPIRNLKPPDGKMINDDICPLKIFSFLKSVKIVIDIADSDLELFLLKDFFCPVGNSFVEAPAGMSKGLSAVYDEYIFHLINYLII